MAIVSIDVSEVQRLGRRIQVNAGDVEDVAARIVAKTAYDIQATAQVLVPVDTGFLKSTIGVDVDGLEAEIGPTAEYGAYVEEGTSRMAPQPYMGPSADRHVPKMEAAFTRLGERVAR